MELEKLIEVLENILRDAEIVAFNVDYLPSEISIEIKAIRSG